jgi:hypothetical protein
MKMMNTLATTFLAVTVAAVMGVAAQDQSPTQTPPGSDTPSTQAPGPAPEQPAPEQPAPAQPAPDQATAGAAMTVSGCVAHEGSAFTLTDAKPAGDTKADVDDEYTLVAGKGVNFAPHVGHQVELTGTASPATDGGTPTLNVSALKMTAPKCQ